MSTKMVQRIFHVVLLIALLTSPLSAALPVRVSQAQTSGFADVAGGDYHRMKVVLHVDHAPEPGGIATFTFSATPLLNAPDLTFDWRLPDGGELVDGPATSSKGVVNRGVTVEEKQQIRFPAPGIYTVEAVATYHPDSATTYTAVGVLFLTIDAAGSSVSDIDPRIEPYQPPRTKPTIDKSGMAVAADAWGTNVPDGCFTVTGQLAREDREPLADPPRYRDVMGPAVPVHHVLVEMREEDTISDDSYGHTVTDANGRFSFSFCDDDGVLNSELELYYRVCAEVWDESLIARIMDATDVELYCWDSRIIESEGGNVDFGTEIYRLTQNQAAVFNIADSLYWAARYWNINTFQGAPAINIPVNVRWEAGKGVDGSFYNEKAKTIVIADDASNFDQWDDSVIIHEWGHFIDHMFSCNGNPGGPHTLPGWNAGDGGDRLSWGEGFADYYQSAARTIMPKATFTDWYIDVSGPTVNFENVAGTAGALNEAAVASLLWDFMDTTVDISDTVAHGHAQLQRVFADPAFKGNAQCNMASFLTAWRDVGYATDAATAATVVQNVNIVNPFATTAAAASATHTTGSASTPTETSAPLSISNLQALAAAKPLEYRWWDQVTMVVDNSASMAGQKLDAVKALIREQENDLRANPRGTQFDLYAFNASSVQPFPLKEARFFVGPELYDLVANGADAGCPVNALYALVKATEDKYDGQAWVYTDGESQPYVSPQWVQQQLAERLIRGSVVMLAGCNSTTPTLQSNVTGAEKNYLGLAADGSQPASIVPYLLTALGTGGNFLYVPPDQLANAVDILRAQASHSAGAGSWSDYVSARHTYRWDRLEPWEYGWFTPATYKGQAIGSNALNITIPTVKVYGYTYDALHVYGDGVIGMGFEPVGTIPFLSHYLDVLDRDGMEWYYQPVDNPGYRQAVYSDVVGEWVVITTQGLADSGESRGYQVLINTNTGEIRYQYNALATGDAANAEIGLWEFDEFDFGPINEVVVSNKDVNGAKPGMGYKFIPAPPQPSKSYSVTVDALMSGIGFLQTGYSGTLNPMSIVDPNGNPVDCGDTANVLCISLNGGLLQYVQVNVNGNAGTYVATVSGNGTFSFNAMAASALQAKALGKRTLALEAQNFLVDLGRTADNNKLSGWLQSGNGARFGEAFTLYDDGEHGDDQAGDGIFGSDAFMPPGQGVAYLWVQGAVDGTSFVRSVPAPFNFQPLKVEPDPAFVQGFLGSQITVRYAVTNQDQYDHCYVWEVSVPDGWQFVTSSGSPFCVSAGATAHPEAYFVALPTEHPGGVSGEFKATFTEQVEGRIVGGASVNAILFRPLADVAFDNRWEASNLRPDTSAMVSDVDAPHAGDSVTLYAYMLDDQGGISGWSGTLGYDLTTTLGSVTSPTGVFENGRLPIVFTAGSETGEAVIRIVVEGSAVATTTLQIRLPFAANIDLVATPDDLRGDANESKLVATVLDEWGDPVVGQQVRLSVSSDNGVQGTIQGNEVITATTDSKGQVSATFVEGEDAIGTVVVRAEALVPQGNGFRVTQEDAVILTLNEPLPEVEEKLLMPLLSK